MGYSITTSKEAISLDEIKRAKDAPEPGVGSEHRGVAERKAEVGKLVGEAREEGGEGAQVGWEITVSAPLVVVSPTDIAVSVRTAASLLFLFLLVLHRKRSRVEEQVSLSISLQPTAI